MSEKYAFWVTLRPQSDRCCRGEAKVRILNFKTTWSEFQKASQTTTEATRGEAELRVYNLNSSNCGGCLIKLQKMCASFILFRILLPICKCIEIFIMSSIHPYFEFNSQFRKLRENNREYLKSLLLLDRGVKVCQPVNVSTICLLLSYTYYKVGRYHLIRKWLNPNLSTCDKLRLCLGSL